MTAPLQTVLGTLHRALSHEHTDGLTDGELLRRYRAGRDEAAFEALVWRHAGMVLATCRRVLGDEQHAEDAFQATFLALARSAGAITRQESVGGWLHRVAGRVARRARAQTHRQSMRPLAEVELPAAGPDEEVAGRDLRRVLDEEVARLPAKLRVPVVLCYLEGRTNDEAARELGWPRGTVATRLAGARQRLRTRLARRGLTLSAGLLTLALTKAAAAASTRGALVLHTTRAALAFARVGADASALVTAPVLTLTQGVLRSMFLARLPVVAAALVAVALAVTALAAGARSLLTDPPSSPPARAGAQAKQAKKAPARARAGQLLFYRQGHLTLINPDGKGAKRVSQDRGQFMPGLARLSPDGKRVAFLVQIERGAAVNRDPRRKAYVRRLDEPEPGTDLGLEAQTLSWSPDGKQLAATNFSYPNDKTLKFTSVLVDVKTRKQSPLKVPDNQMITDWSWDGRYFLTTEVNLTAKAPAARLHLVRRDGSQDRVLTKAGVDAAYGRLSPDGRKVLYMRRDAQRPGKRDHLELFVLDVRTGRSARVDGQPLNGTLMGFCWSPDGKRIAYSWRQDDAAPGQPFESHLVVADPDGGNSATIVTERGESSGLITLGADDWR